MSSRKRKRSGGAKNRIVRENTSVADSPVSSMASPRSERTSSLISDSSRWPYAVLKWSAQAVVTIMITVYLATWFASVGVQLSYKAAKDVLGKVDPAVAGGVDVSSLSFTSGVTGAAVVVVFLCAPRIFHFVGRAMSVSFGWLVAFYDRANARRERMAEREANAAAERFNSLDDVLGARSQRELRAAGGDLS